MLCLLLSALRCKEQLVFISSSKGQDSIDFLSSSLYLSSGEAIEKAR